MPLVADRIALFLVENSNRALTTSYKKRLFKENLLKKVCVKCGLKDLWQGEEIILQIHHTNGNPFDHRLDNLMVLCPNCHSQTDTYVGRKNKTSKSKIKKIIGKTRCKKCNIVINDSRNNYCKPCYNSHRSDLQSDFKRTKIDWPSIEELKTELLSMSYASLGKKLGISGNAIKKHLNKYSEK
jgi:hypothetical protein